MSKIHNLFNKNLDDSLLDKEDNLSQDEKDRVLKMTVNKINKENSKPKRVKHSKKKLLVGILVASLLTIGTVAVASEYFDSSLDNRFLNFLSIDKNDTYLDGASEDLNISVVNNGVTVNVTQTLGDKHSLYILMDVIIPDNIELPKDSPYYFYGSHVQLSKNTGYGWYLEKLETEDSNPNKHSYLLAFNASENLSGSTITLDLKDFGYYDENDNFNYLAKGNWLLSWKLNYTDISKTYHINKLIFDKEIGRASCR